MEQTISPDLIGEIEQTLSQVAEISAARIVSSQEGVIQEIHILASPAKSPKQIVRDIESTIMARFGIPIDHKKVSIAQLGSESTVVQDREVPDVSRARIHAIHTETIGARAVSIVTLEMDGELHRGTAEGPASVSSQQRLVAEATLQSVEDFVQGRIAFALEDVAVFALGREKVASTCVALVTPQGEQVFTGTAMVKGSETDSIARATLDAINRRLGFLTAS